MKIKSLFLFINVAVLTIISSCSCDHEKDKGLFSLEVIEQLSCRCSSDLPNELCLTSVYLMCSDGEIAITSFRDLAFIYSKFENKNYPNFKIFLETTLNKKFKMNINSLLFRALKPVKFQLDKDIHKLYINKGISGIKVKFVIVRNSKLILKNNLTGNEINTIAYYFFKNGYVKFEDDYIGISSFVELNRILIKK